jgi:hypothetical protein
MSRPPPEHPTAIAHRPAQPAQRGADAALLTERSPQPPVRRSMVTMLQASVQSWGDVVSALLIDMGQVSEGMTRLGWMSTTMDLLASEDAYRAAQQQLAWWDSFLQQLPLPALLFDHAQPAIRQARAERVRAGILARDRALADHQVLVAAELARPGLDPVERSRLRRIHDDPDATEWWTDPDDYVHDAIAALPPGPSEVPIVAADLDAARNFSGFNAVQSMREHPELGPRALHMDAALAAALRQELRMGKRDAQHHARVLTDIFWVALRRALETGGVQLNTAVHFVVPTRDHEVQQQFTTELLTSWLHHLETLPIPRDRPALTSRVPLLGKLVGADKAIEGPAAADTSRQITDQQRGERGVWARVKGVFGGGDGG